MSFIKHTRIKDDTIRNLLIKIDVSLNALRSLKKSPTITLENKQLLEVKIQQLIDKKKGVKKKSIETILKDADLLLNSDN